MEFREFASIFAPRNGILSCFFFCWRVQKGIPRVCFYFCSTERNSKMFSLLRKGSERNSENFLFRGTAEIPSEIAICFVYSVICGIIFCRKFPTLVSTPQGLNHPWTCLSLVCYRVLCCTWMCQLHRGLMCTWTCLRYRVSVLHRDVSTLQKCLDNTGYELHLGVSGLREPALLLDLSTILFCSVYTLGLELYLNVLFFHGTMADGLITR